MRIGLQEQRVRKDRHERGGGDRGGERVLRPAQHEAEQGDRPPAPTDEIVVGLRVFRLGELFTHVS